MEAIWPQDKERLGHLQQEQTVPLSIQIASGPADFLSEYTWGVMNHLACGHLLQQPWEMDTSTNSNFMFYLLSFMKKGIMVAQTEAKANKLLDGVCWEKT